jgi:hypothetical protein
MRTWYTFLFPAFDVDRGLEMIGPRILPFEVVYILVVVVVVVVVFVVVVVVLVVLVVREKWERNINLRARH